MFETTNQNLKCRLEPPKFSCSGSHFRSDWSNLEHSGHSQRREHSQHKQFGNSTTARVTPRLLNDAYSTVCCLLLPSGNLTQLWKMVHLQMIYPLKMVIFHSYVSLLEGGIPSLVIIQATLFHPWPFHTWENHQGFAW